MAYSDMRFGGPSGRAERAAKGTQGGPRQLTGRDLADIVRVLERRLAWYGFRSVKVGPFIRIQGSKVLIDLLDRGEVLCRLELDPEVGAPKRSNALALLMGSLREKQPRREAW